MSSIFEEMIQVSIVSAILISILLVINRISMKKYSLKWIQFLWFLIVVRLLLPMDLVTVSIPIDTYQNKYQKTNLIESNPTEEKIAEIFSRPKTEQNETVLSIDEDKGKDNINKFERTPINMSSEGKSIMTPKKISSIQEYIISNGARLLGFIWFGGVLFQLVRYLSTYVVFIKSVKRKNKKVSRLCYIHTFKKISRGDKSIGLYENVEVKAPFSYGLWKKSIVLPVKEYTLQEIEVILQHEYTHILNHDIAFKFLLCVVKSIHWFNPLVYWMERMINQNMELICDEAVIGERDIQYRKMYGMTILNTLKEIHGEEKMVCVSHFEGEGKQLKQRFRNIMESTKRRRVPVVISLFCICIIIVSVITCHSAILEEEKVKGQQKQENLAAVKNEVLSEDISILVLGMDSEHEERARADSIVLAKWDSKEKVFSITSFCRDLYVKIPENGENKLSAAYFYGGTELMKQTMKENFDEEIDYTMVVEYSAFEKVVDLVGGVTIDLTEEEAEYLSSTNFISQKQYRNVVEGEQLLNGNQTLGYVRVRNVNGASGLFGDLGRMERLQKVCGVILKEVEELSISDSVSFIKDVMQGVDTDIPLMTCANLLEEVSGEQITYQSQSFPTEEKYEGTRVDGKCVVLWEKEDYRKTLK